MSRLPERLPDWIPRRGCASAGHGVKALLRGHGLATVCESARCPNERECFGRRTATFLVLGDACTRRCGFCAVPKGAPAPPDATEPTRVAAAAAELGLTSVVVTMVTRDDLLDGGAGHVAATVRALRERLPEATVEILVSDFAGRPEPLRIILDDPPDVFNHNLETVPRLYATVRPGADYRRSLDLLFRAAAAGLPSKSGLMLGLGETEDEVASVMADLRRAGCRLLTLGQYLRPRRECLPVQAYIRPERFDLLAEMGYKLGFEHVASGPLVRSSWRAGEGHARVGIAAR